MKRELGPRKQTTPIDVKDYCMSDVLNPGDVVQLKSGGPKMTVVSIYEHEGESHATCEWFDDNDKPHHRSFHALALDVSSGGLGISNTT